MPPPLNRTNPLRAAIAKAQLRLLRQRAKLAQARRDWTSAVALWRKCTEKAPDRFHQMGYLSALIYAGQLDEAAIQAERHRRIYPTDENGPIALARIAEARGEVSEATEHWRKALELRPGSRQALIRLGAALLSAKNPEEAEACAHELVSRYPDEPHGAILQVQLTQARAGFQTAAPLWRAAANRFPNDLAFLLAYGRALIAGGAYAEAVAVAGRVAKLDLAESLRLRGQVLAKQQPYQDLTEFWQSASAQLPDNADITRKLIHAALWARRLEDAEQALRRLFKRHPLSAGDADFTVGLANGYIERRDFATARQTIRGFMHAIRGQFFYRAAALRLNRIILVCFPKQPAAAAAISRKEQRFMRMVQNAGLNSGALEPLTKIAALETALRESGATALLDSDIDPACCRSFIQIVRERLAARQPFSLIRLGDGEANAFQDRTSFDTQLERDAAERERIWWGRALPSEVRESLARKVRDAALAADALGFPTREWFLRDVRPGSGRSLASTKSGRGLLVIAEALQTECSSGCLRGKLLVSAHLPQDLHRWNLYGELLDGAGEIVLVSCHQNLPKTMEKMFDLRIVHHVLVPPGDSMRETQHRVLSDDELPPRSTAEALDRLGSWPAGRLVLVGAGYAGKPIVDEAKRRGGVALDLGSIFDRWMGVHTRSYQDLA